MNLTTIGKGLSKLTGRTGLVLSKHSPTILLVVGVTGVVGAAVLACRSTLKVDQVISEHKDTVKKIHDVHYQESLKYEPLYSEQDMQKDLVQTYVKTGVKFVKLYGPAILLGAASIGCIVGSHKIMTKRNLALVAAYKAIEEGFDAYRKRVVEDYGEEKDYMYKHGLKAETITETEVDAKGKEKKVEKTQVVVDGVANVSQYARYYDKSCREWSPTPEYNRMYLTNQQRYFNDLLNSRGHVFLNEIYDALGIPRTSAGQVVGWVKGHGDGFIDFGIYEVNVPGYGEEHHCDQIDEERREFVNGYRNTVLLDFNVDGIVYDMI